MRLPTPLSRRDPDAHKNRFGHVLILAGSERMLGAAALCGLAAMRSGAGLTTVGVARSLNLTLHKKLSSVIMTLPLPETNHHAVAFKAYPVIKEIFSKFQAAAVGPGMGQEAGTQKFVLKMIEECPLPLVVDADALNIVSKDLKTLKRAKAVRVLTPHAGEMGRLTGLSEKAIEKNRTGVAASFAKKYNCVLLLKGRRTVVASPSGKIYVNRTGNAGMATAGSGDVLTGMIAAFLGQGIEAFEAAKTACHLHGKAGDLAAKHKSKISMIATDIIDELEDVIS